MKKLEIDAYVGPTVGFPPKSGTWDFLQQAYQEMISAIIKAQIGASYDATKVYNLLGLTKTVVGLFDVYSGGALFYNEEIYLADPTSFATGTGVVFDLLITQYTTNADPVIFTDSIGRNVHNIRRAGLVAGASGSGTLTGDASSDYSNLIIPKPYNSAGIVFQGTWSNVAGGLDTVAAYKIDDRNQCFLSGRVMHNAALSGTSNVLQLPFTLAKRITGSITASDTSTLSTIIFDISTAGMVSVQGTMSECIMLLDQISFRIA